MKSTNSHLEKQKTCLLRASKRSVKASDIIRSLVFAGFGLIWIVLQADNMDVKSLKIGTNLGNATLMLCGTVIFEFTHLTFDVAVNLYQGRFNRLWSDYTMKRVFDFLWILWFAKIISVIVGYIFILCAIV